jgi:AcrR family transcriptional regulator
MKRPADSAQLSPNQAEKRRQIVEAARVVLARDGLAACTARTVAESSPLTKSAIHYYFSDMDKLIDEAMAGHIAAFGARLRDAAAPGPDRLWHAIREYLTVFTTNPGALLLWYEYWIDSVRRGRSAAIDLMFRDVKAIFTELLAAAGSSTPDAHAHALLSYLIGTATQQAVTPLPLTTIRAQVTALCGLPPH